MHRFEIKSTDPQAINCHDIDEKNYNRKPFQKTLAVLSILGLALTGYGCGTDSDTADATNEQQPENTSEAVEEFFGLEEEDDDDIFVYSGGKYYPYRSFTGAMSGASLVAMRNGTYIPYTGAKHPSSWSSNPGYVKPSSSGSSGKVTSKSGGASNSSFGAGGSSSSFGSSSSGTRSSSSSIGSGG